MRRNKWGIGRASISRTGDLQLRVPVVLIMGRERNIAATNSKNHARVPSSVHTCVAAHRGSESVRWGATRGTSPPTAGRWAGPTHRQTRVAPLHPMHLSRPHDHIGVHNFTCHVHDRHQSRHSHTYVQPRSDTPPSADQRTRLRPREHSCVALLGTLRHSRLAPCLHV